MTDVPPPPQDQPPTPPSGPMSTGPVYTGPSPTQDDRTMAMLAHLLAIFTSFVGPLIIWLLKKDTSPFVDDQGKEALNFQITLLIGHMIAGALWLVCIGAFITAGLGIVGLIFCILAAVAANKGEAYRYPVALRLIS